MNILLLGFEFLEPEFLVNDDHLMNFRRLMEIGCYGMLEKPTQEVCERAWEALLAGQFSITGDYRNDIGQPQAVHDQDVAEEYDIHGIIWDIVIDDKKIAYIIGDLLFPIAGRTGLTYIQMDADYFQPVEKKVVDLDEHKKHLQTVCSEKFEQMKRIIGSGEWDFMFSLDTGLAHLQSVDEKGVETKQKTLQSFYHFLDQQLGELLDILSDDTILMLVSMHSMRYPDQLTLKTESIQYQPDFFILAAANSLLRGEIEGVEILDLVPTLLELGGYDIPTTMGGNSFVTGKLIHDAISSDLDEEEQAILRERLSGLGYF